MYFLISAVIDVLCVFAIVVMFRTSYVKYRLSSSKAYPSMSSCNTHAITSWWQKCLKYNYQALNTEKSEPATNTTEYSIDGEEALELADLGSDCKEATEPKEMLQAEDPVAQSEYEGHSDSVVEQQSDLRIGSWQVYKAIVKRVWLMMVVITLNYGVTLSVFPGLISEIPSATYSLGDWMPILLMVTHHLLALRAYKNYNCFFQMHS